MSEPPASSGVLTPDSRQVLLAEHCRRYLNLADLRRTGGGADYAMDRVALGEDMVDPHGDGH